MSNDEDYYYAFTHPGATANPEYLGYPWTDEYGNFITDDARGKHDINQYVRYRDQRNRIRDDNFRGRYFTDADLNDAAAAIAVTGGGLLAPGQPGAIYRIVNGQRQLEIIDEPADYHVGSQNLADEEAFHDTNYLNNQIMHYPQRFKKSDEFKRREKEHRSLKLFGAPISQNTVQFGIN